MTAFLAEVLEDLVLGLGGCQLQDLILLVLIFRSLVPGEVEEEVGVGLEVLLGLGEEVLVGSCNNVIGKLNWL